MSHRAQMDYPQTKQQLGINILMKHSIDKQGRRKTSELTTATNNTYRISKDDREMQAEALPSYDYLLQKIDKLRKENDILLEWNRQAQKQKLELKETQTEHLALIQRLTVANQQKQLKAPQLAVRTQNQCPRCIQNQKQIRKKQSLLQDCKTQLQGIKRQMAEYAVVRAKGANQESELKDKIISKLQKQLLDSRIECMKLKQRMIESGGGSKKHREQESKVIMGKSSGIRKNLQKNILGKVLKGKDDNTSDIR